MALIQHMAIVTEDAERLAEYYVNVFGMKITRRTELRDVFLTDGNLALALLHKTPNAKVGVNHWGFTCTEEEKEQIHSKMAEYGLRPEAPVNDPNRPYLEEKVSDIDGNRFDISTTGVRGLPENER